MDNFDTKNILEPMTRNFEAMEQHLRLLETQSSKLAVFDSISTDGGYEVEIMQERFREHQFKAQREISELKTLAKGIYPEVDRKLRAEIKSQVRSAIRMETKRQVGQQIKQYVPIPLGEQVGDIKGKMSEIRIEIANSQAKVQNSGLDNSCQFEPFAPILTPSGEPSAYYPADLASLLAYDDESLKKLVTSYGLEEDESWHINCVRFLEHVGATGIYLDASPEDV